MTASQAWNLACRCCGTPNARVFYQVDKAPANSVLLLGSRREAVEFPVGTIALALCQGCGFIFNAAFDEGLLEYSERYDPTQAFSPTFNAWHRKLAERVISEHNLKNSRIVEIGCGKGEFLQLLCELGGNTGVGFDPAYEPSRDTGSENHRTEFIRDFFSEKYSQVRGDFVCCKMTLEHISPVSKFLRTVRQTVGDNEQTVVFFQVPDVQTILEEVAFWDIYYEHCSYFSVGSLARAFAASGFRVVGLGREYRNQYLMLDARPCDGLPASLPPQTDDLARIVELADSFAQRFHQVRESWRRRLEDFRQHRKKIVIWGSGSKGVSFLTTLGLVNEVEYVVDINPHRQGYFMAGTGQKIVAPGFLEQYQPDVVIIMNPVYQAEIEQELAARRLTPQVLVA